MIKNHQETKTQYHKIRQTVFQSTDLKDECRNVLLVFEILLITLFTNTKVERLLSKMNRIKTIERNWLGHNCLDLHLCVGKERPPLAEFSPIVVIGMWFSDKVCYLTYKSH